MSAAEVTSTEPDACVTTLSPPPNAEKSPADAPPPATPPAPPAPQPSKPRNKRVRAPTPPAHHSTTTTTITSSSLSPDLAAGTSTATAINNTVTSGQQTTPTGSAPRSRPRASRARRGGSSAGGTRGGSSSARAAALRFPHLTQPFLTCDALPGAVRSSNSSSSNNSSSNNNNSSSKAPPPSSPPSSPFDALVASYEPRYDPRTHIDAVFADRQPDAASSHASGASGSAGTPLVLLSASPSPAQPDPTAASSGTLQRGFIVDPQLAAFYEMLHHATSVSFAFAAPSLYTNAGVGDVHTGRPDQHGGEHCGGDAIHRMFGCATDGVCHPAAKCSAHERHVDCASHESFVFDTTLLRALAASDAPPPLLPSARTASQARGRRYHTSSRRPPRKRRALDAWSDEEDSSGDSDTDTEDGDSAFAASSDDDTEGGDSTDAASDSDYGARGRARTQARGRAAAASRRGRTAAAPAGDAVCASDCECDECNERLRRVVRHYWSSPAERRARHAVAAHAAREVLAGAPAGTHAGSGIAAAADSPCDIVAAMAGGAAGGNAWVRERLFEPAYERVSGAASALMAALCDGGDGQTSGGLAGGVDGGGDGAASSGDADARHCAFLAALDVAVDAAFRHYAQPPAPESDPDAWMFDLTALTGGVADAPANVNVGGSGGSGAAAGGKGSTRGKAGTPAEATAAPVAFSVPSCITARNRRMCALDDRKRARTAWTIDIEALVPRTPARKEPPTTPVAPPAKRAWDMDIESDTNSSDDADDPPPSAAATAIAVADNSSAPDSATQANGTAASQPKPSTAPAAPAAPATWSEAMELARLRRQVAQERAKLSALLQQQESVQRSITEASEDTGTGTSGDTDCAAHDNAGSTEPPVEGASVEAEHRTDGECAPPNVPVSNGNVLSDRETREHMMRLRLCETPEERLVTLVSITVECAAWTEVMRADMRRLAQRGALAPLVVECAATVSRALSDRAQMRTPGFAVLLSALRCAIDQLGEPQCADVKHGHSHAHGAASACAPAVASLERALYAATQSVDQWARVPAMVRRSVAQAVHAFRAAMAAAASASTAAAAAAAAAGTSTAAVMNRTMVTASAAVGGARGTR